MFPYRELEQPRTRQSRTRLAAVPDPPQPFMGGGAAPGLACEGAVLKAAGPAQAVFERKIECKAPPNAVSEIRKAVKTAVGMLDKTITELTQAREAVCRGEAHGLQPVTACWLKYKLGVCIDKQETWTKPGVRKNQKEPISIAEVIRRLVRPRDELATNQIKYACGDYCASPSTWAKVNAADKDNKCFARPEETIFLCKPFWNKESEPYRAQTLIHEAVHLTHCAAKEDEGTRVSIGSPECLAQFVAAVSGQPLDPEFLSRCGFTNTCGARPAGTPPRCGAKLGKSSTPPDWGPKGPGGSPRTDELEFEDEVPSTTPITVTKLADELADLVFAARNPRQAGRRPAAGSRDFAVWRQIRDSEIWRILRSDSSDFEISRLIYHARHPSHRDNFKSVPVDQRVGFSREFAAIRKNLVQPLTSRPIQRGPVKSRTIFVADTSAFATLPALTRQVIGDEMARIFEFVGRAEPNAPIRIIVLQPERFPEDYNLSDAVVAVSGMVPSAYVGVGFRQQNSNINRRIREMGGRLVLDPDSRVTFSVDRAGLGTMRKFVPNVPGIGAAAIAQMDSAVGLLEVIQDINNEALSNTQAKLAVDPRAWTDNQQRLMGLALGRSMAHEVRHLYVEKPVHAETGLGAVGARIFGENIGFSTVDQNSILAAIRKFENDQGSARVIPTYNREADFPF